MLLSMTGFGRAICSLPNKKTTIELKTLNSKQLDLSVKVPQYLRAKEHEMRNDLAKKLVRGKVEFSIRTETLDTESCTQVNATTVKNYIATLKQLGADMGMEIGADTLLQTALRMPEVLVNEEKELDEQEWAAINASVAEAIDTLQLFREQEGQVLQDDITGRVKLIASLLDEIPQYEQQRIDTIKERIANNLKEFYEKQTINHDRFEQEIIYYLEKIDVTEEKVRLKNHCTYFLETVDSADSNGKKLGFIAQEIGREINTIGSKANHAAIQKLVVQMKDELEKIKEQLMNVL